MSLDDRIVRLEARVAALEARLGVPTPTPLEQTLAGVPGSFSGSAPTGVSAAVLRLIADGNKIGAIKQLREETGLGLREAKDQVEAITG